MPRAKRAYLKDDSFRAFLAEELKDPEFAREYEALGPEYEIISQIIALRNKRRMTQAELAERVGTKQPSIARWEKRGPAKDLDFLRRVADALDARVEVRIVPRKLAQKAAGKRPARLAPGRRAATKSVRV